MIQSLEKLEIEHMKLSTDMKFIKSCKTENLIQTLEKVNVSIKSEVKNLNRSLPDW